MSKTNETKINMEELESKVMNSTDDEKIAVFGLATMSKDIKETMVHIEDNELRFLIDNYYQTQEYRISISNQLRSIEQGRDGEGADAPLSLQWLLKNVTNQELQLKKLLDIYTDNNPVCQWAKSIKGIGPVFSAVLYAYFDISKAGHYNTFWSYAGLNDNNNPWLGKEKAKYVIDSAFKERDKEVARIDKIAKKELTKAKYNALSKVFEQYNFNDEAMIADIHNNSKVKPLIDLIKDDTMIPEYLIHLYDHGWVSDNMVRRVYTQLNGRRRFELLCERSIDTKDGSKTKGHRNRATLQAYLAKPPYNSDLKKFMYLIGESFAKVSNRGSLYGRMYKERKAWETANNENLLYKDQAEQYLREKNYGKDTKAYKAYIEGKLPEAQITRRAERYATKLFISHLFECMHLWYYGEPAPTPYPISHQGHVDYIGPEVPYEEFIKVNK